jgi:hypothetical protein
LQLRRRCHPPAVAADAVTLLLLLPLRRLLLLLPLLPLLLLRLPWSLLLRLLLSVRRAVEDTAVQ